MKKTLVKDVMTTDVVTIDVAAPYQQIVALLYSNAISGLPVMDTARRVCGVVSGADLSRRHPDTATDTVHSLMTSPAIVIGPEASAEEALRVLGRHRIGRLPVIEIGSRRLTGIVTRSDLLQIHLRSDDDIRAEIETDAIPQLLRLNPRLLKVFVRDGIVTILGHLERRSVIDRVVEVIRHVEGVIRVMERIDYDIDDRNPAPAIHWGGSG